jgi:hypothetical protein
MAIAVLHYRKANARKHDRHEMRGMKSGIKDLSDVQTRG